MAMNKSKIMDASNGSKATGRKISSSTDETDICVLCYRRTFIFSIGECDHPVCYECSTRMRVLCERTECPICRKDMAKVIFIAEVRQFCNIDPRNMNFERRYAIYFENEKVMRCFDALLEHICQICEGEPKLRTFDQLKEHMRRAHERFYCELCVDNLLIFTAERRSYDRAQLAQHRRKGDTDNKSHRGHPLCEFCDSRYMDNDELYRHLRRDHFFCHFCDADGIYQYYDDYNSLRGHFRSAHFLCEEGTCMQERFTSVFRTKMDEKAHIMGNHSHAMSKEQVRQARTVDIAFSVNQHRGGQPAERGRGGKTRGGGRRTQGDYEAQELAASLPPPVEIPRQQQALVDVTCKDNFPTLIKGSVHEGGVKSGGSNAAPSKASMQSRFTFRQSIPKCTIEEFPSLISPNSSAPPSTSVHVSINGSNGPISCAISRPSSARAETNVSIKYSTAPRKDPPVSSKNKLGEPNAMPVSQANKINSKKISTTQSKEDFPSLSSNNNISGQTNNPSWLGSTTNQQAKKSQQKQEAESAKVQFRKEAANFVSGDFPSLAPLSSDSQQHMKNFYSKSVVLSNSNNKNVSIDENQGAALKNKKKKDGPKSQENENRPDPNVTNKKLSSGKSKKKFPLTLANVYDDDDGDIKEDFSIFHSGDYQSVDPNRSSNIKCITLEELHGTKQSRLKIGPLKPPPKLKNDDFPSLGSFPSLNDAPPKFKGKKYSQISSNDSKASNPGKKKSSTPPGFSDKNGSPFSSDSSMTFTSSLGEEFQISAQPQKETPAPVTFAYSLPPNFDARNQALISSIREACQEHDGRFVQFKVLSDNLRQGVLNGHEYYIKCKQVIGKESFTGILPELLALLPDIIKQQSILNAYKSVDKGVGCRCSFAVCDLCNQVLKLEDYELHSCTRDTSAIRSGNQQASNRRKKK